MAIVIQHALPKDAEVLLALQKLAYQSEAKLYNDWSIPPLTQTLESLAEEFAASIILKAVSADHIVGSVRAQMHGNTCRIGRLFVHPAHQGQGIASRLLQSIEECHPKAARFELFTGSMSASNIRLYLRAGYHITRTQTLSPAVELIFLEKPAQDIP